MIYGQFIYRRSAGKQVEFEVFVDQYASGTLSIACPCCGRRSKLNPHAREVPIRSGGSRMIPGHKVSVDRRGRVTIDRPVICPNESCGWFVRVEKGLALDSKSREDYSPDRSDVPSTPLVEDLKSRQRVRRSHGGALLTLELFA